ncbi:MAG TPA: TIGR03435 family protein [Bryobacteraceae bacterium]|jgi:uncharacterized protein (TIGR03435 family)
MKTEELLALGMFGGRSRLGERIEMLLERGRDFSPQASKARLGVSALALAGSLIAGAFAPRFIAFAQATPQFEVASVKPQVFTGQPGSTVGVFVRGNTLSAEHADLYALVSFAYDLRDRVQLSGGPAWAATHGLLSDSELFQVTAKAAGDMPPPMDQFRLMLQGLLADRFKLKVHHVSKDLPVYNLVIGKNASKLKESAADTKFSMMVRSIGAHGIRIMAQHAPMTNLLNQLPLYAKRPVFDKTGLTGFYDFELEWADDSLEDAGGPSLFTALQDQLGLKLEPGTAPFDTVVIDHAEKPDAN